MGLSKQGSREKEVPRNVSRESSFTLSFTRNVSKQRSYKKKKPQEGRSHKKGLTRARHPMAFPLMNLDRPAQRTQKCPKFQSAEAPSHQMATHRVPCPCHEEEHVAVLTSKNSLISGSVEPWFTAWPSTWYRADQRHRIWALWLHVCRCAHCAGGVGIGLHVAVVPENTLIPKPRAEGIAQAGMPCPSARSTKKPQ